MVLNLSQLIKSYGTRTVPAAETESIGLTADALAVMVFAEPSGLLYLDGTISLRQPGFVHLDSYLDKETFSHLPGLSKNSCQRVPLSATQLNRRAVRLQCAFIAICPLAPGLFCGTTRTAFLLRDRFVIRDK